MPATATATPFPELDSGTLNALFQAFQADTALRSVCLDGRHYGAHVMVDGQRVDVEGIHVCERDLHFIHSLDATRFGTVEQCEICRGEADQDARTLEG